MPKANHSVRDATWRFNFLHSPIVTYYTEDVLGRVPLLSLQRHRNPLLAQRQNKPPEGMIRPIRPEQRNEKLKWSAVELPIGFETISPECGKQAHWSPRSLKLSPKTGVFVRSGLLVHRHMSRATRLTLVGEPGQGREDTIIKVDASKRSENVYEPQEERSGLSDSSELVKPT